MKPQGRNKRKGSSNSTDKLKKFKNSVTDFVKSKCGFDDGEKDRTANFVKKRSRKELRKEKRKLKKAKMKSHYMGLKLSDQTEEPVQTTNQQKAGDPAPKTTGIIKDPSQRQKKEAEVGDVEGKSKRKVRFGEDVPKQQKNKKSKLEKSRKRALLDANVEEDKEIKKLEKYLGLNKRRNKKSLPQSFAIDGLDYILGVLEPGSSATGLYESDEEIDKAIDNLDEMDEESDEQTDDENEGNKDRTLDMQTEEEEADDPEEDGEQGDDLEEDEEEGDDLEEDEEGVDLDEDNASSDEEAEDVDEDDDSNSEQNLPETKKPNADIERRTYIPPHLREGATNERKAELEKLKRNIKGLINRLSQPNMASISRQLETLYMSTSRKDMNETLTDILLAACVTPALMPERLLMEHILLVSVLHYSVGLEVGAHFLETVAHRFNETYNQLSSTEKECDNLVSILAHLYNFQVVHAVLVFDILKKLVTSFSSRDIELVLLVLKNVGFGLRKDDPLTLKELISEAQRKANTQADHFQDQTRIRFMLETMLALKNNDMRKIPGYDPEPVEKLRRLQRSLIKSSAGSSDLKLRVSLDNLLEADQVGRWWIVGSSWSGAPMIEECGTKTTSEQPKGEQYSAKILELARKQRMNTDIRRNIFCVLMSCEDYLDAFEKLLRLKLKHQQERDIVHVLIDCCLQEKTFNKFYAVLAEKFCLHDRRFQMTFQFSLWDKFKDLTNLPHRTFSNLALLVTHLLHRKCLSLAVLKAIEFGELDKPKVKFLKQILLKLLKETEPEDLINIFGRISGIPKLGMLREGLKLFISHFLLRNASTRESAEQVKVLLDGAEVATKAMEARDAKIKL